MFNLVVICFSLGLVHAGHCEWENWLLFKAMAGEYYGEWQHDNIDASSGTLFPTQSHNASIHIWQPDPKKELLKQYNEYEIGDKPKYGKCEAIVDGWCRIPYGPYTPLNYSGTYESNLAFFSGDASSVRYSAQPPVLKSVPSFFFEAGIFAPNVSPRIRRRGGATYRPEGKQAFVLDRVTTIWEAEEGLSLNYSAKVPMQRGVEVVPYASWPGKGVKKFMDCSKVDRSVYGGAVPLPDYKFDGDLYLWLPRLVERDGDFEVAVGWQYSLSAFERLSIVYEKGNMQALVYDVFQRPQDLLV